MASASPASIRARMLSGQRSRFSAIFDRASSASPASASATAAAPAKEPCLAGSTTASASLHITASGSLAGAAELTDEGDRPAREPARLILVFRERAAELIRAAREPGRSLGQEPGAPHQILLGRREPRRQPARQVR